MTRNSKIVLLIILALAVIQLVFIGSCISRITRYESNFPKVKIGQQRETVINLMGNASEIRRCRGTGKTYSLDNCYEIYGYFTFIKYRAIAFDSNGNVIKTFEWTLDDGYGKPEEFIN